MAVVIHKERGSWWLNISVVLVLMAIVAVELRTSFKPGRDSVREEARVAAMIAASLKEREASPLLQKARQEQEAAGKKLEDLSRKMRELEAQTEQKLSKLSEILEEEKRETGRRMEEQIEWQVRLAEQIARTKHDLGAPNGRIGPIRLADAPQLIQGMRLAGTNPGRIPGMNMNNWCLNPARQPGFTGFGPTTSGAGAEFFVASAWAGSLYRAGDFKGAIEIYTSLIESHPEAPSAYIGRGNCYGALQDFAKAIDDFAAAIRLMPNEARAYLARSRAYLGNAAMDLALSDAAEALRLDPTLAEAHLVRAEALDRKGEHDAARAAREEAASIARFRRPLADAL